MTKPTKSLWSSIHREAGRARRRYLTPKALVSLRRKAVAPFDALAKQKRIMRRRDEEVGAYRRQPLSLEAETFALVRVIGNDLEPRHRKGQSFDNVQFILQHEAAFEGCKKLWVVNRIADPAEERRIIDLLDRHGQSYSCIPFIADEFGRIGWNLDLFKPDQLRFSKRFAEDPPCPPARYETLIRADKNRYVMNNNGARNRAIESGREHAKWIMPWDGNCYLTQAAFETIRGAVGRKPHLPIVIVPMARIIDNSRLFQRRPAPAATEEPQIIFRRDSPHRFDEKYTYGRRPKVEMLWRLGVPGVWDKFIDDPWDLPKPPLAEEAGLFQRAGWVARLESGRSHLEVGRRGFRARHKSRDEAIVDQLDGLDAGIVAARLDPSCLALYDEDGLALAACNPSAPAWQQLQARADQALARRPASVMDKTGCAPSGDRHDYFHPAPYWWPDPATPDGLPYIQRDGERVPDTELHGPGSERFDRTRLQTLFDDAVILALAATVLGDRRYAIHAASLVRTWFVDPATRMNPHLAFAQVRAGHDTEDASGTGIIEFKELYLLLDAVRMIERVGAMGAEDGEAFRCWLGLYANWLDTSAMGRREFRRPNNHGTFFDVQRLSIAIFLNDSARVARQLLYARERLSGQLAADGSLPAEIGRTRPLHYVMFTLQGWVALARLLASVGDDLWRYETSTGQGLEGAIGWLAAHAERLRPTDDDVTSSDMDRLLPLMAELRRHRPAGAGTVEPMRAVPAKPPKPVFHPDCGIAPFWFWKGP